MNEGVQQNACNLFESTGGHTVVMRKYADWGFQHSRKSGLNVQTHQLFHWSAQLHTPPYHCWSLLECMAVHTKIYYFWRPTDVKMNMSWAELINFGSSLKSSMLSDLTCLLPFSWLSSLIAWTYWYVMNLPCLTSFDSHFLSLLHCKKKLAYCWQLTFKSTKGPLDICMSTTSSGLNFSCSSDHPDWFELPGRQFHHGRSTCQANPFKFNMISKGAGCNLFLTFQVFTE